MPKLDTLCFSQDFVLFKIVLAVNGSQLFTLLLAYLSDKEAKQRSAPSATCVSSCRSSVDRACTQAGSVGSAGSIFVQSRDTTVMAECSVSLCTRAAWSRMKDSTHARPPASNTEPASREQISSNTWHNIIILPNIMLRGKNFKTTTVCNK